MPAASEITIPVFKKKFLQFIIVVIHNCYLVLDKTQKRDVDLINKLSNAAPQHHVTLCGLHITWRVALDARCHVLTLNRLVSVSLSY
jgi:hypothetical protein